MHGLKEDRDTKRCIPTITSLFYSYKVVNQTGLHKQESISLGEVLIEMRSSDLLKRLPATKITIKIEKYYTTDWYGQSNDSIADLTGHVISEHHIFMSIVTKQDCIR